MGKLRERIASLFGVKGKDAATIASQANPFPVEVENFPAQSGITQAQMEAELDEKFSDLGQKASAASAPVALSTEQEAKVDLLAKEAGGNLAAIKAKTDNIPPLGQALAAASTPVVLTAAQQAALTPPAAIAGYSLEATQLLIEALLGAGLPAALRNTRLDAADTYTSGQILADQAGAGGVLTFTFANPMDLIWAEATGAECRADPFGGTPTASLGIICQDAVPKPIVVRATVVKVFAPVGATRVNVWGQRYS